MRKSITLTAMALIMAKTGAVSAERIQYSKADAADMANEGANLLSWTFSGKTVRNPEALTADTPVSEDERSANAGGESDGSGTNGGGESDGDSESGSENTGGDNGEGGSGEGENTGGESGTENTGGDNGEGGNEGGSETGGESGSENTQPQYQPWVDSTTGEVTTASCRQYCTNAKQTYQNTINTASCELDGFSQLCTYPDGTQILISGGGNFTGDGSDSKLDGSGGCTCAYYCFTADMPVMLADGSSKRADEISYDDELLVWNFDEGHFDKSKPIWIKILETATEYDTISFSDGSVLSTVAQHRIFNLEAGKFTYAATDETPLGTHTLNMRGELVQVVSKKHINEDVVFCNIVTKRHLNCFVGGVLTSCRFNNIYPIKDLKFVKDNRPLVPYSEYAMFDKKWYDGLRLAEQCRDIRDSNHNDKTITDYVIRIMKKMA
ncbi:MAG: hypothetical protein IJ870_02325 [Alphaproteobacteria bacterium]|nr:hypothetical protein [Alphaproteobacteria bacterium]